jgi:hypothetical protein
MNNSSELKGVVVDNEMDTKIWRSALFELIDNHPNRDTVDFLFVQLRKAELMSISGTYIYAIQECKIVLSIDEIDFLFEALIGSNYEVAWMVSGIFHDLCKQNFEFSLSWLDDKVTILQMNLGVKHINEKYIKKVMEVLMEYQKNRFKMPDK